MTDPALDGVSVATIVHGRLDHLRQVALGLARGSRRPDQWVVARMGGPDPRSALGDLPFPVDIVDVEADPARLPLAEARNAAARAATGSDLIFLDVDCIPSSHLVANYAAALQQHDALLMGSVSYLPSGPLPLESSDEELRDLATPHPARPEPTAPIEPTDHYELLWSLSFAARRATFFDRVGGFDEAYRGYGAEDTDLGLRARAARVPLLWVRDAEAFHQHHPSPQPPVQHVDAIVANARTFHDRWGRWPMEGWLRAFDRAGLVRWDPVTGRLERTAQPPAPPQARGRTATPR